MQKMILAELFKRPIAYQPIVAKAVGSVKLGIFWSQLYYWSDKTSDAEGWIYKTQKDIYEETSLSRKEQETARRDGRNLGLIEEKLAGQPARVHYKISMDRMLEVIEEYLRAREHGQQKLIPEKVTQTGTIAYLDKIPEKDLIEIGKKYQVTRKFILDRADDVITYCQAKNKMYRNYNAALKNFVKKHLERYPEQRIKKPTASVIINTSEPINKERSPAEQSKLNKTLADMREKLKTKITMK